MVLFLRKKSWAEVTRCERHTFNGGVWRRQRLMMSPSSLTGSCQLCPSAVPPSPPPLPGVLEVHTWEAGRGVRRRGPNFQGLAYSWEGGRGGRTSKVEQEGGSKPVQCVWAQISRVEARIVFSVLKWTLFCFCRLILLVRGHFLYRTGREIQGLNSVKLQKIVLVKSCLHKSVLSKSRKYFRTLLVVSTSHCNQQWPDPTKKSNNSLVWLKFFWSWSLIQQKHDITERTKTRHNRKNWRAVPRTGILQLKSLNCYVVP